MQKGDRLTSILKMCGHKRDAVVAAVAVRGNSGGEDAKDVHAVQLHRLMGRGGAGGE